MDLKLVVVFVRLLAHSFATIANFQWFSKLPSPLKGMVECNHWDQWFSDGFGVRQPLATMVFDGCAPLVRRWNGYVPLSKSKSRDIPNKEQFERQIISISLKYEMVFHCNFKLIFN